jgi:hypothetical protein
MRAFYLGYSNCDAVRRELSWTHYRLLLRVDKPEVRAFYEAKAVNSRWSTREPERQINYQERVEKHEPTTPHSNQIHSHEGPRLHGLYLRVPDECGDEPISVPSLADMLPVFPTSGSRWPKIRPD